MRKTHRQQLLELRHGMPLEDFIRQTLEENRGRYDIVAASARKCDVGPEPFRGWCHDLGIDIDDYRRTEPVAHTNDESSDLPW